MSAFLSRVTQSTPASSGWLVFFSVGYTILLFDEESAINVFILCWFTVKFVLINDSYNMVTFLPKLSNFQNSGEYSLNFKLLLFVILNCYYQFIVLRGVLNLTANSNVIS